MFWDCSLENAMTVYWKANGERDWIRENDEQNQQWHEEHRARLQKRSSPEEIELWGWIFGLPIRALTFVLFLPVRYGYGKQYLWALLFLFFMAPILLCVVALVLGVHAHPQVFLNDWQTYVVQHPGATHWTWLVRDMTRWIHAS
jgi:hypothetical protein